MNKIKPTNDSEPLQMKKHPPMSAISLQSVAEYFMPDASEEKIWEFIKEIQDRHIKAIKEHGK